jgi:hypothetical protein
MPGDFVIRPPTTTGDDAKPSISLLRDIRRVLALMQDERILAARDLYNSVRSRLEQWKNQEPESRLSFRRRKHAVHTEDHEYRATNDLLNSKKAELDKLEVRMNQLGISCFFLRSNSVSLQKQADVIGRAKQQLEVDDDWILSQSHFGITTYYRREKDDSLSIKVEGELIGVPLFEQVAVLREVDLHCKWVPFCTSSLTIKDIDKLDIVGWFVIGLPQFGLARDGCFRAIGCDSMMEDGTFVLVGQGVEDRDEGTPYGEEYFLQNMNGIQIPDPPRRLGSGRTTIRNFSAEVHVLSPTTVRTVVVANFNPNLSFIPQSLLDFVLRKICGVAFFKLQHAAKKACTSPVRNAHAKRMRQQEAFYKGWLMPKFQAYCNHLGWTMPPVPAFNLTEEELEMESRSHQSAPLIRSLTTMESFESKSPIGMTHSESAPNLHDMAACANPDDSASTASSISGLSSMSIFKNNPVSRLLRELEERTQVEKARKIEEGRQRAAARLKPKAIPQDNHLRLQQLKKTKYRKMQTGDSFGSSAPGQQRSVAAPVTPIEQDDVLAFADRFHLHGRRTRSVVTLVLVVVLLVALYSDVLLGLESELRMHDDRIWMNAVLDVATFLYMGITAAVHFVMCYVSLVYAFQNLDIGTKAGNRSKEYYGANVRFLVAGASGAIVTYSTVSAIARVWLRWGVWYALQATDWVKHLSLKDLYGFAWFLDNVPEPIETMTAAVLSHLSGFLGVTASICKSGAVLFQHWFVFIFVRSNFVGRAVAAFVSQIFGIFSFIAVACENYVANVVTMYADDDVELVSWRGDAIDAARPLLAYTGMFLFSILVLFNFSQSVESKKSFNNEESTMSDCVSTVASDAFPLPPEVASTPLATNRVREYRTQRISSISMQDDVMSTGEGKEDLSILGGPSMASDAVGSMDTRQKKLFRLRRQKKKERAATDGSSIQAERRATASKITRMQTY